MEIKAYLDEQKQLVESALARCMLQAKGDFADHIQTLHYSIFAGGKRIRPILCLAAARMLADGEEVDDAVLPIACALECIHTYSLIHDDLPAMDDDDLRRGKPTNHAVYGEASAILAGDGLQCYAFDLLSTPLTSPLPAERRIEIISVIAQAAGPLGMVGGQYLDIIHEGEKIPYSQLRTIHRSKTGMLITASVMAGGIAVGATPEQRDYLRSYGNAIGLAFQIVDDILNVESTTEQLGKAAGSDARRGKATYPSIFGIEKSKEMAGEAVANALLALSDFGEEAEPLRGIARFIIERNM